LLWKNRTLVFVLICSVRALLTIIDTSRLTGMMPLLSPSKHCHSTEETTMSTSLIGWGKGENVTSAGWQVTLCDPIMSHEFPI